MSDLTSGDDVLPRVFFHLTINLAVWALLASGVLAWFHGAKGAQRTTPTERMLLGVLAVGWIVSSVLVVLR
jgi:hypothetical protein